MAPDPLAGMTPTYLDEFAAWAHAVDATPGVTIVDGAPHDVTERDAPHGSNTDDEMAV